MAHDPRNKIWKFNKSADGILLIAKNVKRKLTIVVIMKCKKRGAKYLLLLEIKKIETNCANCNAMIIVKREKCYLISYL